LDAGGQNCFSKDGRLFLTFSTNGFLEACDVQQRKLVRRFGQYPAGANLFRFGAGRKTLLAGDDDHLDLWDLESFEIIKSWPRPQGLMAGFALSNDGEWVLQIGPHGSLILDHIVMGERKSLETALKTATSVAFSADGRRFAASSSLGFADIWETGSLRHVATVGDRLSKLNVCGFSPDGSRLVTGNPDQQRIQLWDLQTQRELIALQGVLHGKFSPDGNVMACSGDKTIHIYRAPTLAEIDAAEKADATNPLLGSQPAVPK
jgi:WD40 repeat protein